MKRFSQLFIELDTSTSTNAKVDALARYFASAPPEDAAWAAYFLAGGKPRQTVGSRALREFALAGSGLPPWLFEESYQAVGDLAETIALILPPAADESDAGLAEWIVQRLLPLRGQPPAQVVERLHQYANELDTAGRFLLIKLIGGGFRVGVSRLLVTRALALHAGVDPKVVAQRLIGYTDLTARPDASSWQALVAPAGSAADAQVSHGTPYPFFLAFQLAATLDEFATVLGPVRDWHVEWKYDGIRAQLVKRDGRAWLWSRGEELISERFPEIVAAAANLPDGIVLDGEVLVWDPGAGHPAPFARLQTRITRKNVTPKLQSQHPVVFVAYDVLEVGGVDCRQQPQQVRRATLESLLADHGSQITDSELRLSPLVREPDWYALARQRAQSRACGVEGLMLKRVDARYGFGRSKETGAWWKWKIEPMTVDCVLVYAQRGHGRRASLYTDYTFAVWDRAPRDAIEAQAVRDAVAAASTGAMRDLPQLVPFAKAYSGLTDAEIRQVDATIRKTTVEQFGPVRSVVPELVFELGFEGIQRSPRHKSGIAVRFPRILRWRHDKPLHDADTLASLEVLLSASG